MESSRGEEVLESLSSRVELSKVADILRMYGKALTGDDVAVHPAEALAEKGIGWVETEAPSTEGSAIFLPPHIEEFPDKDANFRVYKVYCTHQAGHLEFGTFDFQFAREGVVFPPLRHALEEQRIPVDGAQPPLDSDGHVLSPARRSRSTREPLTDMERFFDLFAGPAPGLRPLRDSRGRADRCADRPGVRRHPPAYGRPPGARAGPPAGSGQLPLRQAFVENMVRASLGGLEHVLWPEQLMPIDARGRRRRPLAADCPRRRLRSRTPRRRRCACTRSLKSIPNLFPEDQMEDWAGVQRRAMNLSPMTSDPRATT